MKKIEISTPSKSYQVITGEGIIKTLKKEIERRKLYRNIFIVTDDTVKRLHSKKILSSFEGHTGLLNMFSFKPGEESKNHVTLNKIYQALLSHRYGRDTLIIAFGGGVVGDMAGYAASTFMRGVQYLQVPTTLLAAVDSSVGGKTGIDFEELKNVVGTFYQPDLVLADIEFFDTLPQEELLCGLGEILKYGILTGGSLYNFIAKNQALILKKDRKVLSKLVCESVTVKSAVVQEDERESGLRKILNLGHTFAHAYETVLHYQVKHGQAVIAGLKCAVDLSFNLGIITEKIYREYGKYFSEFFPALPFDKIQPAELYDVMLKDKKNSNGQVRFVLPSEPGKILVDVETDKKLVLKTLAEVAR
ncbi:MAG: 3-dehydroquinate synthase [Bacteroidota bacterium]